MAQGAAPGWALGEESPRKESGTWHWPLEQMAQGDVAQLGDQTSEAQQELGTSRIWHTQGV